MLQLIAMIIGALVGCTPHFIYGDDMSFFTDFMVSTVVGGAAYVVALYRLKQMRGDF